MTVLCLVRILDPNTRNGIAHSGLALSTSIDLIKKKSIAELTTGQPDINKGYKHGQALLGWF